MSRIDLTSNPATCKERTAASRPEPGPLINTSTFLIPSSAASRAAASAVTCAAYGVFFFEPLKPFLPAVDQATVLPDISVMVTSTLLKVALMCASPSGDTLIFFFFFAAAVDVFVVAICYIKVFSDYFFAAAFFLPATVLRFPLRVRAFVRVRCPLTGKPLRCRNPR